MCEQLQLPYSLPSRNKTRSDVKLFPFTSKTFPIHSQSFDRVTFKVKVVKMQIRRISQVIVVIRTERQCLCTPSCRTCRNTRKTLQQANVTVTGQLVQRRAGSHSVYAPLNQS